MISLYDVYNYIYCIYIYMHEYTWICIYIYSIIIHLLYIHMVDVFIFSLSLFLRPSHHKPRAWRWCCGALHEAAAHLWCGPRGVSESFTCCTASGSKWGDIWQNLRNKNKKR
jgi:hypothetical protein